MKIQQAATPQATPQIKVRTDLTAGDTCRQQVKYWTGQYNQIYREAKQRGCVS